MKKILFALLILLVPFMVYADTCDNGKVKIKSVIVASREGLAQKVGDITVIDKTIDVNIKMFEVGDSITYDILIENDSDEDYELDNKSITSNNEHVHYSLVSSENVIPAKTSKTVQLKVEYVKEVDESEYRNGIFTDNKNLAINLSNDQPINNPFTKGNYLTIGLIILLLFQLGAYFVWNKKQSKGQALLLLITLMIIPITTYAACKISVDVNSSVEIEKVEYFKLTSYCGLSGSLGSKLPLRLPYPKNATWEEYIESDLFESLEEDVQNFIKDSFHESWSSATFSSNESIECYENAQTAEEYDNCYNNHFEENYDTRPEAEIISDEVGVYSSYTYCEPV